MNVLDAVYRLLEEEGKPLHYREITRRILDRRLWTTTGKTPEATISARLSVEVKSNGDESRFVRIENGTYGLRKLHAGLATSTSTQRKLRSAKRIGPDIPQPSDSVSDDLLEHSLSFSNAAEKVLNEYGDRKPMHYREITKKILELGLVQTRSRTPEATLNAQISSEIKRAAGRGENSRFVQHGRGFLGLRKWMGKGLAFQIGRHNAEVRKKLLERLKRMDPIHFEQVAGELLVALGFDEVVVTSRGNDGGIDVRGILVTADVVRIKMAVQVKRWKHNVQAPVVQQVRGSLGAHEQGLIITTSDFGAGARKEAERSDAVPVALMNGEQLVKLMVENDIGVTRAEYDLLELVGEA